MVPSAREMPAENTVHGRVLVTVITSFMTKPAAFTLPRISLNMSPSVLPDVPSQF